MGLKFFFYVTLSGLFCCFLFTQGVALGCLISSPVRAEERRKYTLEFTALSLIISFFSIQYIAFARRK